MKRVKMPLKDKNGKQIYDGDFVKIEGLIYKCTFWDRKYKQYWFIGKDGAGWNFNLDRYEVELVRFD